MPALARPIVAPIECEHRIGKGKPGLGVVALNEAGIHLRFVLTKFLPAKQKTRTAIEE